MTARWTVASRARPDARLAMVEILDGDPDAGIEGESLLLETWSTDPADALLLDELGAASLAAVIGGCTACRAG